MKLLDYLPSWRNIYGGMMLTVLGVLLRVGGSVGVKLGDDADLVWIEFPVVDAWVCWVIFCFGLDEMFCGGRVTLFLAKRFVAVLAKPVLENMIGEERMKKWVDKWNETLKGDEDSESIGGKG